MKRNEFTFLAISVF